MTPRDRARARALQAEHAARGDALGWFDALYREADGDPSGIPWADLAPRGELVGCHELAEVDWRDRACAVVGCGLGDDAEFVASTGGVVTAFDVSDTAVAWCRRRFPQSAVTYVVADLFAPPAAWHHAFDVVIEINTLQTMSVADRSRGVTAVSQLVAPGGTLLVICRGREADEVVDGPPWPLSREELAPLETLGFEPVSLRESIDADDPPVRRFVAAFRRA